MAGSGSRFLLRVPSRCNIAHRLPKPHFAPTESESWGPGPCNLTFSKIILVCFLCPLASRSRGSSLWRLSLNQVSSEAWISQVFLLLVTSHNDPVKWFNGMATARNYFKTPLCIWLWGQWSKPASLTPDGGHLLLDFNGQTHGSLLLQMC